MKPKLARILVMAVALGALTLATDASWSKGGGGGGHGGGHGGGGHGGGHAGSGHGGGHWGSGGHGGRHFGGGHVSGRHFAGVHHGAAHLSESHIGRNNRFASGHQLGRNHFNHNAFGNRPGWNHFARVGGAGWGGWGGGWGGWGGWVGPVFWPFLLGDVLYCYPFWSYGTAFAYDYGPYAPAYGYGGTGNFYGYAESNRYARRAERPNQIPADVTQSCSGFAPEVTGLPIDRIRRAIQPTGQALMALDELNDASSKASNVLSASCPSEPPLTPLARLDAVETRLEAMRKAIQIVRPPLASLYDSLRDEQRQRLDAIGAEEDRHGRATAVADTSGADTLASLCGSQAESFTKLPMQRIEEIVKPTGPQQAALDQLNQASAKAADELRGSCPAQAGETPTARLDAMNNRLDAMVQAAKTLRPTLGAFYASLTDEQKAQFNSMGQQTAMPQENATGGGR
jgi:hypothetical protein